MSDAQSMREGREAREMRKVCRHAILALPASLARFKLRTPPSPFHIPNSTFLIRNAKLRTHDSELRTCLGGATRISADEVRVQPCHRLDGKGFDFVVDDDASCLAEPAEDPFHDHLIAFPH